VACGYRALASRKVRSYDAAVVAAAVASAPLALAVRWGMLQLGGYREVAPRAHLVSPSRWLQELPAAWTVLRLLFGSIAEPGARLGQAGAWLGMACLIAALAGLVRVLWTWRRASRAEHMVAAIMAINFAVFVVSGAVGLDGYREIAAVLACGGVLAARAVVPAEIRWPKVSAAIAIAAGLVALLPLSAAAGRAPAGPAYGPAPGNGGAAPMAPLVAWLEAHRVSYAVSNYWNASVVTVATGGRVQVRTLDYTRGTNGRGMGFRQPFWEANSLWYDPARHDARYAIAQAKGYTAAVYERFFGKPTAVYQVGTDWVVLQYPQNLLPKVLPPYDMAGLG
jgi:hypothetical protein